MYLFRTQFSRFSLISKRLLSIAVIGLVLLFLVGCTSDYHTGNTSQKSLQVGVVFDSGGLGDKSFNDSANAGIQRAEKELGINSKYVQSASRKDYEQNLVAMASSGCNLVFAVGLDQQDALTKVAHEFPQVKFAIVDGNVTAPNVRSLNFDEEQGSFLVGCLAANVSKTGKIGFVGGENIDLINKFLVGYEAGALYANSKILVLPAKYVGDWDNVDVAHAEANQLFGEGADIVYHAAGRAGLGVITAAKEQGKYAVGVDSDQDSVAPGFVLTSMVKHVDESVYQTISDDLHGKFTPGTKVYDLKANGVGLSDMTYTKDKIEPRVLKFVDDVKEKIISGQIVVPSKESELPGFLQKYRGQGQLTATSH